MCFIQRIIKYFKLKKEKRNAYCNELVSKIEGCLNELDRLFLNTNEFIEPCYGEKLYNDNILLTNELSLSETLKVEKATQYKKLIQLKILLSNRLKTLKNDIINHNEKVAEGKLLEAYNIIGNVENRELDKQQMMCIVKEVHNHLVVAGAGTGKTTTIIGKIKYLLGIRKYKPSDFLVLSFTNKSASEMKQRIDAETKCNIEASTFHKLGMNIITSVERKRPKITNIDLSKFIKDQILLNMKNKEYLNKLKQYFINDSNITKTDLDFENREEYEEYIHLNPPVTLKKENVKSYGEMEIANFFFENNIEYIYEQLYKVDTRTIEYSQYHPDFYLPKYDIYIEYFGINKNGDVASYFKGRNNLSASEAYKKSIEWKRTIHQENNTCLIECYAYEKFDDSLVENLKTKLIEKGVSLNPKTIDELWGDDKLDDDRIEGIAQLIETIINLIKSNNYTFDKMKELNINNRHVRNNNLLLYLVEPIYNAYLAYLEENNEIDFNDMINIASKYIEEGKYINAYKYVIIDEYQDISKSRYNLIRQLRNSNVFDIFCVGDDWQSIYRFAGSDISYILDFEKFFGPSEISKIETTYRFNQKLIEVSSNFVMENPRQLKKMIKGINSEENAIEAIITKDNSKNEFYTINSIAKQLDKLPKDSTIFFIGRYKNDIKLLSKNEQFSANYNQSNGLINITYFNRKDLRINFITAHKSKGLQSDYVFIINNKGTKFGFPCKLQDHQILNLLLENNDNYQFAEERRLFYVALTRARKKVFLVINLIDRSCFIEELMIDYQDLITINSHLCPICGGELIKYNGEYGEFLGCSNYKTLGCRYTKKISA